VPRWRRRSAWRCRCWPTSTATGWRRRCRTRAHQTRCFAAEPAGGFAAVNLAALSPTLIESELFGHRRGAFAGAVDDHEGWFARCGPHGAVFLDEIGDLDAGIQVKLLRVLQSREFHRIGETDPRRFVGKVIAATNRDLDPELAARRFREDLYYRLCADTIQVPTLREQLAATSDDLRHLVLIIARRVAGPDEGARLADEVQHSVDTHLGRNYPWPGNMRELEQCVRSTLIRGAGRTIRQYRSAGSSDIPHAPMAAYAGTADIVAPTASATRQPARP